MNSLLGEALGQIPGYAELAVAKTAMDQWRYPIEAEPDDLDGYLLDAALRADAEPPADLVDRVHQRMFMAGAHQEARALIQTGKANLQSRLDHIVGADPDPALRFLAGKLATLVATVAKATKAKPNSSPHASNPSRAAWLQISEAVGQYDAIRAAQLEVVIASPGPDWVLERRQKQEWLLRVGLVADHFDNDRWWIDRRAEAAGAHLAHEITGESYWAFTDREPIPLGGRLASRWPASGLGIQTTGDPEAILADRLNWLLPEQLPAWASPVVARSWWPTEDRVEYLSWLCTNAHPWVPTHQQMLEVDQAALAAVGARTSRLRSPSAQELSRAAQALVEHRRITGSVDAKG